MQIAYIDLETDRDNRHILDMGAICGQQHIHTTHLPELLNTIQAADFLCGHHFLHHDFPHLQAHLAQLNFHAHDVIDTLLLSPLLFPARPYHALDKDYKTQFDESNNPLTDCFITRDLLDSEQQAFFRLPENLQTIFYQLLGQTNGFAAFFRSMGFQAACNDVAQLIHQTFHEHICHHAPLDDIITQHPTALAYALSLIHC
ncbi:hypothetical protein [Alysiella crassa]|uniref:Uncharacterized protein n=1 Tax=Alysiella crassa TaxID=153491 RepID=A0A376BNS0_9NEIS|nr:hypothetical protein [Alysiella crassa]UOP07003.1 hypothetical protein LVJ80_00455 [Alysiella crassa]SSY70854.1 Uncharacterised protein [Alysiella crassa]